MLPGANTLQTDPNLGAPVGTTYNQALAIDKAAVVNGSANVFGIPLGLTFFGTAFTEPKLITLASGFEAVTHERANNLPQFTPTIPDDHVTGVPLNVPPRHDRDKPRDWRPHHL